MKKKPTKLRSEDFRGNVRLSAEEQQVIGKLRSGAGGIDQAIRYLEDLKGMLEDRKRTKKASPKQLDQVYRLARKRAVDYIRGWALEAEDQQDLMDDVMQDEQFPVDMEELSDAALDNVERRIIEAITDAEGEAAKLLEKLK